MKPWHLWVSVGAVLLFGFLLSQDAVARLAWHRFNRPDITLKLVRRDAGLAMLLGNYYFGQTIGRSKYDLAKAELAFQKAVAADPDILWGHYQLARVIFLKADYEEALAEINAELAANPENLRSLYVRGLIYGYRNLAGDLEKAEADFRRFTRWAPTEWAGYNDLTWILAKQEKNDEARNALAEAFREVPDAERNPWLWNSLGVADLNLGSYRSAAAAFARARTLAGNLEPADWRTAYPGNDPRQAEAGLQAFRDAIAENLTRAEQTR